MLKRILHHIKFLPKYLFCLLFAKPLVYLLLGLNINGRENIPKKGPAIIVGNHNSHLDGLVIMSLFPLKQWPMVRPIGAQDYFFQSRLMKFFAKYIVDIIPICRTGDRPKENLLDDCEDALKNNNIVIIFPEGTRGEPEHLGQLRKGVCHLSNKFPEAPIVPIFMHGLGKSLPKGEALLVPFFVDVIVNAPIYNNPDSEVLLEQIRDCFVRDHDIFINDDFE